MATKRWGLVRRIESLEGWLGRSTLAPQFPFSFCFLVVISTAFSCMTTGTVVAMLLCLPWSLATALACHPYLHLHQGCSIQDLLCMLLLQREGSLISKAGLKRDGPKKTSKYEIPTRWERDRDTETEKFNCYLKTIVDLSVSLSFR